MKTSLTRVEQFFEMDELIVSKTDLKGRITYANKTFIDISGYTEDDVLGAPHSIIRHPEMPRAIYKLLCDTIMSGKEIFAYVVNRCLNGDHYWVLAHVTPTFDNTGQISGYHSNRRVADREAIDTVTALYRSMQAAEQSIRGRGNMAAGLQVLMRALGEVPYDEFVFSLAPSTRLAPLKLSSLAA